MAVFDEIADDYTLIDGTEDVTYTPMNPAGTPIANVKALKQLVSIRLMASLPLLELRADDTIFSLFIPSFSPAAPAAIRKGDEIKQADNVKWRVLESSRKRTSRWYCICRKYA